VEWNGYSSEQKVLKNYLEHHGVIGMKWGVRRYQNADGSLTEKGRKRLKSWDKYVEDTRAKKMAKVNKKLTKAKVGSEKEANLKKASKFLEKDKKIYSKMSDKEKLEDRYIHRKDRSRFTGKDLVGIGLLGYAAVLPISMSKVSKASSDARIRRAQNAVNRYFGENGNKTIHELGYDPRSIREIRRSVKQARKEDKYLKYV
jgi:hypothetical protein